MTEEQTEYGTYALIPKKINPYALDVALEPVDWRETREHFAPVGVEVAARELVGRSFTILELRPCQSSYDETQHFYWIKAVFADTGALFHTSLGGGAVVEILDDFNALNTALLAARETGDLARVAELEGIGAGRPIYVTLGWKAQGTYQGYYVLE